MLASSAPQVLVVLASLLMLLGTPAATESSHRDDSGLAGILASPYRYLQQKTFGRPIARKTPTRYGCMLFPGFQAIDVFGPLDALNTLSWSHNITLALIAKTMDPVSTVVRNPAFNRVNSSFGESVLPTHTFADAPPLDVLLVPGGIGTMSPDVHEEIAFIKATYPKLRYLITVCTGAGLAARAGVLDGKNATTNKATWASTTALGPHVNWITHARWVVAGNIWSSSGVTAGIDVLFAWMEAVYGNATATRVANSLEYERHLNSSWDPFADLYKLPPN